MAKYRKKPIVIEAEQWFPGKVVEGVIEGVGGPFKGGNFSKGDEIPVEISPMAYIETLEGRHIVQSGDWIITCVVGEKYPCKPDIFEQTYELVQGENR